MSNISVAAGDLSRTWHDFLGWVRGKGLGTAQADAAEAYAALQRIGAGLSGAKGDVPGLIADVEAVIPQVAAAAAARGMNLAADGALALSLQKAAKDLERAYADYCAGATPILTSTPTTSLAPSK